MTIRLWANGVSPLATLSSTFGFFPLTASSHLCWWLLLILQSWAGQVEAGKEDRGVSRSWVTDGSFLVLPFADPPTEDHPLHSLGHSSWLPSLPLVFRPFVLYRWSSPQLLIFKNSSVSTPSSEGISPPPLLAPGHSSLAFRGGEHGLVCTHWMSISSRQLVICVLVPALVWAGPGGNGI